MNAQWLDLMGKLGKAAGEYFKPSVLPPKNRKRSPQRKTYKVDRSQPIETPDAGDGAAVQSPYHYGRKVDVEE